MAVSSNSTSRPAYDTETQRVFDSIHLGPASLVREFHEAVGAPVRDQPLVPPRKDRDARVQMAWQEYDELEEEVAEFFAASQMGGLPDEAEHIAHVARELADIVYVAYGTALEYGLDLDAVIAEVHAANMRKVVDGKVKKDRTGKVLKPDGWKPPDVRRVVFG